MRSNSHIANTGRDIAGREVFHTRLTAQQQQVLWDTRETAPIEAYLTIRDITGKEMARIPLREMEGQTVWDTRSVATGAYTVELVNGNASQATLKLVVRP